jgi:hypothetical protein
MSKVLFMMERPLDPILTKEELRHYHDGDLLQLMALTDAIMYKRPLTDNEKHNFWLVVEERNERGRQ